MLHGMGGIIEIDPKGPDPRLRADPERRARRRPTSRSAGPTTSTIYFEGAVSGRVYRFKAPYPGLIGPGGVRLAAQP